MTVKAYGFLGASEGLTLIELITALAILVLLLAAAVPVWQLGLRIWQQESAVLAVQQEERMVLEMVANEVRRARKDSVEIVMDGGSGQPALRFEVDEEPHILAKISYLQIDAKLIRRKDNGDGAGTNVYLTNLNLENGFSVVFIDPHTGNRRMGTGERLSGYEAVELGLRCRRNNHDYAIQTRIAPRN